VLAAGVLSGTRVVRIDTLRAVNWNVALLVGTPISLAIVLGRTGVDRWLAGLIIQQIGDRSSRPVAFVGALTLLRLAV
jgi:di/tricarboxylate transporter